MLEVVGPWEDRCWVAELSHRSGKGAWQKAVGMGRGKRDWKERHLGGKLIVSSI